MRKLAKAFIIGGAIGFAINFIAGFVETFFYGQTLGEKPDSVFDNPIIGWAPIIALIIGAVLWRIEKRAKARQTV